MSTVCQRLHLQLGGWVFVCSALTLALSLTLSLLLSLFSRKLRLLRRLARIFKYTRVLSLPLNHIFILYLFAVPPSMCCTHHTPHPMLPYPHPLTPTRRPLASERWHFDCLHFALSRRKQTQQQTTKKTTLNIVKKQ